MSRARQHREQLRRVLYASKGRSLVRSEGEEALWWASCPEIHVLKPQPPGSQKGTVFGDRIFTEMIRTT